LTGGFRLGRMQLVMRSCGSSEWKSNGFGSRARSLVFVPPTRHREAFSPRLQSALTGTSRGELGLVGVTNVCLFVASATNRAGRRCPRHTDSRRERTLLRQDMARRLCSAEPSRARDLPVVRYALTGWKPASTPRQRPVSRFRSADDGGPRQIVARVWR
jgi:hypothetical protein